MGSPQPPPVMPLSQLANLPFDVQYTLLASLDSFKSLDNLTTAFPSIRSVAASFPTGLTTKIASTEFASLSDALLAVKVLDADEGARQAVVVEHYDPELAQLEKKSLDNETLEKLHILNTAAEELAGQFLNRRGMVKGQMKNREMMRFKRSMWRTIVLFELYKEQKALAASANDDEEPADTPDDENDDSETADGDNNGSISPARAYLSRFPHQHVLELDCVREFLTELATDLAESARDASENVFAASACADIPASFGITLPRPSALTAHDAQPTCACAQPPAERDPDTPAPSVTACSICSEHLPENLLLLGPVTLVALQKLPESALPRVMASLAPLGKRDLFWDETMKFWVGIKGVYEGAGKMKELPPRLKRMEDVMTVGVYGGAVLDCGQVF